MPTCSSCKTKIVEAPASGICPECGHLLGSPSRKTEVHLAATMELAEPGEKPANPRANQPGARGGRSGGDTAATVALPAGLSPADRVRAGGDTAATIALPGPGKHRSVAAAPRKLSVQNMDLITGTWSSAAGDATPRTSLKFDSKGSTGMGSSLVVNPRGVRSAHGQGQTSEGADYELLEVIGKGGMGVVYSARQASVDRMVAVKMIRPNVAADPERREKFLSEAVVTGDLDHPNIVPIYELGTNESNALFYSMKRVQGTPWQQVIGEKTLNENLEILMKVADAVAFAHANGVVHRDLKPDNVMLGDYGEVLVMDWGLALATSTFRHSEFVTGPDSMGGTPAYMAPEMVTGPFELIGTACDIYLLGALLYEVVTGNVPHYGTTAQECLMAAARNEIQPCEEEGELIEIAYHAMATDPAKRFPSVQDFQKALREYQSHEESISLASRADQELTQARETGDYQSYSHAVFGFQEAIALWDGNNRAATGLAEARLAYAECAKAKGDYELGLSLLDDSAEHAVLRVELASMQRERDMRQKWLTRFKRIAAAMAILVFGVISASLLVVAQAKNRETDAKNQAIKDKESAEIAERAAETARQKELEQKNIAVAAEAKARQEESLARAAERKAKTAEEEERKQKLIAVEAEAKAKAEEQKAIAAKRGEEYAAYLARIGVAAAKIDENAYDSAESLLAACLPEDGGEDLRNWEWGYLKRLGRQGFDFHGQGTTTSAAFAPDSQWFVTAGDDGVAHLWNPDNGRERLAIKHGAAVHAVAVSPDGQSLATAGADGQVRLFKTTDGAAIRTLSGHEDRVLGAAFSPQDGRWLVTCSRDRTVRIWDVATGSEAPGSPLRGHSWWVWSVAFSADQKQLVSAGQDGKVLVWSFGDAAGGGPIARQEKVFLGHEGPVFAAAFSPDGSQVASAGYDKRVLLWQPDKIDQIDLEVLVSKDPLRPQPSRSFEGHSAPVRTVAYSADGQSIASGGDDNIVRVWDAATGKPTAVLRGHSRPVETCAFAPDGKRIVSGAQEGQIKLWNLLDYRQVRAVQGRLLAGHEDEILSAAFSPDGKRVVTSSRDHTARIFEVATGKSLQTLKEGHEFLVSRAAYARGGRWLVTAAGDNSVRLWDATTGAQLAAVEGTGRKAAMAVSSDGRLLFTGVPDQGADNTATQPRLALWKISDDGQSVEPIKAAQGALGADHRDTVTVVAISPDGKRMFSGDETGGAKLWDAATGAELLSLKGHSRAVTEALFRPDGARLLTASEDGTVMQWDVATGKAVGGALSHVDPRHSDAYDAPVKAMALSPKGDRLVTLSEDTEQGVLHSVVRLWDVDRATVLGELYRGPEAITSVAMAEEGRTALTASSIRQLDGGVETRHAIVRRWDLAVRREIKAAADRPYLDFSGRPEAVWAAIEAAGNAGVLTIGGNGASLWSGGDVTRPEVVFKPHGGITSASFSSSGQHVVTGSSDRRAKVWNVASGRAELQLPAEHTRPITSIEYSPVDENLLVTTSADGTARVWQLPARKVLHVLSAGDDAAARQPLRAAAFSPDGKQLVTAGDDGVARSWDVASGRAIAEYRLEAPVLAVACSADGRRMIAGAANGRATVFDLESGRAVVRYLGHTAAINAVAISPDGTRALTGSSDRTVKLWDTPAGDAPAGQGADPRSGNEILTLRHHDQAVSSVAFSPDGQSILSAGLDGTAVLWLTDPWQAAAK